MVAEDMVRGLTVAYERHYEGIDPGDLGSGAVDALSG